MKMETPKKQGAQRTSNTLKSYLTNETYLELLDRFEKAQKKLVKNIDL